MTHLGITEHENPYTESRSAISLWQISKLVLEEIVPQVGFVDLLCNIGNKTGWLEEARDVVYATILTDDKDSRCFSMTLDGMLQFRKEILPVALRPVNHDEEKLEQKTKNSRAATEAKMRFIRGLKGVLDEVT